MIPKVIPETDAKPFKELAFPESAKANARVLVNLLAEHFAAASITGTHREQILRLKEPASLIVVLRRSGAAFQLTTDAAAETDEILDTIDAIELVLKRALGLEPEEEAPSECDAPADPSGEISKSIVRCLVELNLVSFATPRSQPQLEKKLADTLREQCESIEEIADCIMECSGVAELHASDEDLAEILLVCLPSRSRG